MIFDNISLLNQKNIGLKKRLINVYDFFVKNIKAKSYNNNIKTYLKEIIFLEKVFNIEIFDKIIENNFNNLDINKIKKEYVNLKDKIGNKFNKFKYKDIDELIDYETNHKKTNKFVTEIVLKILIYENV